jgi:hypothetical protein
VFTRTCGKYINKQKSIKQPETLDQKIDKIEASIRKNDQSKIRKIYKDLEKAGRMIRGEKRQKIENQQFEEL